MRIRLTLAALFIVAALAVRIGHNGTAEAQETPVPTPSAYTQLLDTEIRGMSAETIAAYRTGSGNGIALPAELNGYPGPRHVLDLADALALTDEQREAVQALYDVMQPEAVSLGEAILAGEAALERSFRERTIDEMALERQLAALGVLQAELRFVHLRTHLATLDILTPEQVQHYNMLRGYQTPPAGGHQGGHGG